MYRILLKDVSTAHFNLTPARSHGKKSVGAGGRNAAGIAAIAADRAAECRVLGSSVPKSCEIMFDNYMLDKE